MTALLEERPGRILVVDDAEPNRELIAAYLEQAGHEVVMAANGGEALRIVQQALTDVVLLDVMMPGMDGYEVCVRLRQQAATRLIPVVMVTSLDDRSDRIKALDAGADDFLSKPVDQAELLARVRSLLRVKRLTDQLDSSEAVIFTLARAVEAKDVYTEQHTLRVADFARAIAGALEMSADEQGIIYRCGMVHDIGKIAISEAVLHKPGRLTADEYVYVQTHAAIGAALLTTSHALEHLAPFVRGHHERWDQQGYPGRLRGDAIPLEARILAVCDAVEAMASDRPYQRGKSVTEIIAEILRCAGTHFDPSIAAAFLRLVEREGPEFVVNSAHEVVRRHAESREVMLAKAGWYRPPLDLAPLAETPAARS